MSPGMSARKIRLTGFPRVSGDEPALAPREAGMRQFSPRERG